MELRYRNLRDKPKAFRAFTGFDMETACGLHNFRTAYRTAEIPNA